MLVAGNFTLRFGVFTFILLNFFSGCSTLVGNVKPVDEKADHYRVLDLQRENAAHWKKLPQEASSSTDSSDSSDVVFQTLDQTAIVSLNSACRDGQQATVTKLPAVAQELTLGFTDVVGVEEQWTEVNTVPAFQKTLEGKLENRSTKIRVLIVAVDKCVYDFSYISSPKHFKTYEEDFARFVKSLNFR